MEKLETTNYLVAYIDLLGTSALIKQDKDNDALNLIHSVYEELLHSTAFAMQHIINNLQVKIFSDNIILAVPADALTFDNANLFIAFNHFVTIVSVVQRYFLEKNILVRGGIACGSLYFDNIMVWGEALLSTYNLESKVADYPRIVVEKTLGEHLLHNGGFIEASFELRAKAYQLKKDFDGMYFIDYMNFPNDTDVMKLRLYSLTNTEEKIKKEKDEKILKKYYWHKNYLTSISSTNNT